MVAIATTLDKSEKEVQINHLHARRFLYGEKIVKICPVGPEIFGSVNSGVTGPKFVKILRDVEASLTLLMRTLTKRYPILFRNARATRGICHF